MKRTRKLLATILSLVMILTALPLTAVTSFAETSGDFGYEILDDGTALITGYTGTATELTIPSEIDGYTVTSIGYSAFRGCTSLKSVTIPDSVTSIGDGAFIECASLESITIGNGITSIGDEAFYECTSLTSITIPDSVTSIGRFAFSGCESLAKLTLPKSLTRIEYNAFCNTAYYNNSENWDNDGVLYIDDCLIFANASKLPEKYVIKEKTRLISDWGFFMCENLKSITIPDSVEYIGCHTFEACTSLVDISIGSEVKYIGESLLGDGGLYYPNVPYYEDINNWKDGVLYIGEYLIEANYIVYNLDGETFTVQEVAENYIVKDGTKLIAENAFALPEYKENNVPTMKSITIPKSIEYIGEHACGYYSYNDCTFETTYVEKYDDFTIYGYAGSEAERYANDNEFAFVALDKPDPIPDPSPDPDPTPSESIGDVNGDEKLSIVDAKWILQNLASTRDLTDEQKSFADVNGDGKVSIVDVKWILQVLAGTRELS